MTTRYQIIEEWKFQKKKWALGDWNLHFSNRKRQLGYCDCTKKRISISLSYMEINPFQVMQDTLLHEIAHALQFIKSGKTNHNEDWKKIALKVGCEPKRCASTEDIVLPIGKYVGVCPSCEKTVHFYRKVIRRRSCSECSTKFNPRFELKIIPF